MKQRSAVSGGRRSKERLLALFWCNVIGTTKMRPLVVGKYAKPRCFKGISSFLAVYKANRNAWMTKDIFTEWLLKMHLIMGMEKRKILLVVDSCCSHLVDAHLENTKSEFFRPNYTSVT
jgi:hypothetical protein